VAPAAIFGTPPISFSVGVQALSPRSIVVCFLVMSTLAGSNGCSSVPVRPTAGVPPAMPAADPVVAPLAFMAGTWVMEQAGGAVIEEHWMAPAGKGMLGSFRRILGNGVIAFYEFTQVVADGDRVLLRQIHVHRDFDVDPRRKDPMVLRLEKVEGTSASFVPLEDPAASNAGSLERVSYRLGADGVMTVRVEEKPRPAKEGEAPRPPQVIELPMRRVGG